MHTIDSKRNFVEDVLTEVFRVYGVSCKNDICERSIRHIVKEYPNAIIVLKEINALDDLFASEISDQSGLIDNQLFLGRCRMLHAFEHKEFLVFQALDLENLALSALSYLADDPVVL